jgi:hypothetical protein
MLVETTLFGDILVVSSRPYHASIWLGLLSVLCWIFVLFFHPPTTILSQPLHLKESIDFNRAFFAGVFNRKVLA